MNIAVIRGDELSAEHIRRWSELQRADPALVSSFFRPEFTDAVARTRRDVFVAILEDAARAVGFFPFQRQAPGIGRPVGGTLSDYHGAIADRALDFDPVALIRACRLRVFDFNHLVASQRPFTPYHAAIAASPYLDLSRGFGEYRRARSAAGSSVIAQTERKARKLAREVGPLRFEADEPDPATLRELIRRKSAQYRRTGVSDAFASRWKVELMERILDTRTPDFAGMLSTLRAGDHLVAAHMGMRSRDALHWWFPAYDPRFARFSPGRVLLLELARDAENRGLCMIDLGRGDEPYKTRLATGGTPLAEGAVVLSRPLAVGRRLSEGAKHVARRTPLAGPGRRATRWVRGRRDERGAAAR